jgi:predicted enzyme related to lactoylglutathione lyase
MKVTAIVPGSPCWAQLATPDLDASKAFYGGLFGWTAETDPRPEVGGYTMFLLDGTPAAAVAPRMSEQQPVAWLISIAATDVDAGTEASRAAGARVWNEPMDVLDIGRWSLLSDPTGAAFALWEAKGFNGFGVVDEPGAFGWIDLSTRDTAGAEKFYTHVFGWEVTPSGEYPMVGLGGTMFGGMMDVTEMVPAEVPAQWRPFFVVADVDASAEKARSLGGQVLHGPEDVQMEQGPRIAVLSDPQGGTFGIFKPAAG